MAKSGPETPPRPAQPRVAEPAGGKNTFDGEESTEVMDVPVVPAKAVAAAGVPPAAVEEPQDTEEKDKKYIAPRVIPAAAVPEKADGAKIVLNIPDARADRAPPAPPLRKGTDSTNISTVEGDKPAVAEVRARRRAPTVKIARPNLAALKQPTDDIDVSLEDDLEPPPPLEAPSAPSNVDLGSNAAPLVASKGLVQAVPIGLAPATAPDSRSPASLPTPLGQRTSAPAHEAPATAIAIHETRSEKSRLPWVLFGALTLGAAAAGVFVATRKPDPSFASKTPAAAASGVATTATATAPAPIETVAVTATAEPTASVADVGTATASATETVPAQTTQVAVRPPTPPATYPRPTATTPAYTAPRPTATFPRPPPKKTSDIPSGI